MLPWSSEMREKEQTSNVSEPLYRAHEHITAKKKTIRKERKRGKGKHGSNRHHVSAELNTVWTQNKYSILKPPLLRAAEKRHAYATDS